MSRIENPTIDDLCLALETPERQLIRRLQAELKRRGDLIKVAEYSGYGTACPWCGAAIHEAGHHWHHHSCPAFTESGEVQLEPKES